MATSLGGSASEFRSHGRLPRSSGPRILKLPGQSELQPFVKFLDLVLQQLKSKYPKRIKDFRERGVVLGFNFHSGHGMALASGVVANWKGEKGYGAQVFLEELIDCFKRHAIQVQQIAVLSCDSSAADMLTLDQEASAPEWAGKGKSVLQPAKSINFGGEASPSSENVCPVRGEPVCLRTFFLTSRPQHSVIMVPQ